MIWLFFKESNQNCFHVMFQPVYTSSFELGLMCVLYIAIGFDVPLAWSYHPKEQSGVLKYSLNENMKLFLGDLAPIIQASRPPIS